ncbi:MAG: hypothetical protein ABII00_16205 [Elusimicrobiota bacterium]
MNGAGTSTLVVSPVTLTVTIDAGALPGGWYIPGASPWHTSGQVISLTILPGEYGFTYGTVAGFGFTVDAGGKIHYDPGLSFLSGEGSSTLVVGGFPVTVNADAVPNRWYIQGITQGSPAGDTISTVLIPGEYHLQHTGGMTTTFSVDENGLVQYDPALTYLSGAGTSTLIVAPDTFEITIDATALTGDWYVPGVNSMVPGGQAVSLTILPGAYGFTYGTVAGVGFSVDENGLIQYDPAQGILSGAGTPTLAVGGFPVAVNADALTGGWYIQGITQWSTTGETVPTVLIPGDYHLQHAGYTSYEFSVDENGLVYYDPALTLFGGEGTSALIINGFPVTINGSFLSGDWQVRSVTGWLTGVHTVTILPGAFAINQPGQPLIVFTLDENGDVQSDHPDLFGDATPPSITAPPGLTVECAAHGGQAVDIGMAVAADDTDPDPAIANDAPALFIKGSTLVTWTATDFSGNSAAALQTVNIQDTAPAQLGACQDVTELQDSAAGTAITLNPPAIADACDPQPSLASDAPAIFPVGATQVTWTAEDAGGNTAQTTCAVTILTPAEATEHLAGTVQDMELPGGAENSLMSQLDAAAASLAKGNAKAGANKLRAFINHVEAQRRTEDPETAAQATAKGGKKPAKKKGKKLTGRQADDLIEEVMKILSHI